MASPNPCSAFSPDTPPTSPPKDYSAIHGNFIPLQSAEGLFLIPPRRPRSPHRLRSRSPQRRHRQEQGVHLHLSLTDAQMDKLASTLAKDEPPRTQAGTADDGSTTSSPSYPPPLPPKSASSAGSFGTHTRGRGRPQHDHTAASSSTLPVDPFASPPHHHSRRSRSPSRPPQPLQAQMPGRASTDTSGSTGRSPVPPQVPPHPHHHYQDQISEEPEMTTDASSSIYSMDELVRVLPHIHPLYVQKIAAMGSPGRSSTGMSPERGTTVVPEAPEVTPEVTPEDDAREGYIPVAAEPDIHADLPHSPLAAFPSDPTSTARKGHKVLVGHNGWLERTGQAGPDDSTSKTPPAKKAGLLVALKRMAKEVAEATERRRGGSPKGREASSLAARASRTARMRISLDPREQSLLYCELEFLLTGTLDAFLNAQFHAGRLDAARYKRVVDAWHHKGRPRVVGFRYDLETQLDLVLLHVHDGADTTAAAADTAFRFHGPRAADAVAAAALLDSMRVNARALRIRTFCQPDSVIAKQLLDSQGLLALLGASEPHRVQLAEVVHFFKTVLEREHAATAATDTGAPAETPDDGTHPGLRESRTTHSLQHSNTEPHRSETRAATQRGR